MDGNANGFRMKEVCPGKGKGLMIESFGALKMKKEILRHLHASNVADDLENVEIAKATGGFNAWKKLPNIRVQNSEVNLDMTEDGVAVKLQLDNEIKNINRLRNSIVVKVFGNSISYSVISIELRRQWSHLGAFHPTNLGCSRVDNQCKLIAQDNGKTVDNSVLDCTSNVIQSIGGGIDKPSTGVANGDEMEANGYGPWIHVNYGRRKSYAFNKSKSFAGSVRNGMKFKVASKGVSGGISNVNAILERSVEDSKPKEVSELKEASVLSGALEDQSVVRDLDADTVALDGVIVANDDETKVKIPKHDEKIDEAGSRDNIGIADTNGVVGGGNVEAIASSVPKNLKENAKEREFLCAGGNKLSSKSAHHKKNLKKELNSFSPIKDSLTERKMEVLEDWGMAFEVNAKFWMVVIGSSMDVILGLHRLWSLCEVTAFVSEVQGFLVVCVKVMEVESIRIYGAVKFWVFLFAEESLLHLIVISLVSRKAVKLDESCEIINAKRLEYSVVTKVFGKELPPIVVAWELRRQWAKFGQFHFTILGKGWYMCSFKCLEALEEVLSGGPWFVNHHIVGMERWSIDFSPTSMKGLTSPIWIRMPHLPLQCCDEDNVALIASMIGVPLLLDGNMFHWGKREFARVCVRMELDKPLPLGVWVDGIAGRFFQKVEYERISTFCFECGMVGHDKSDCFKDKIVESNQVEDMGGLGATAQIDHMEVHESYGPWILVKHNKNKRVLLSRNDKFRSN
ncbi:hypothetical protein M5K25_003795 [Dendrobium thyrsiflorum]|uniref:CCHC-type domain-containing protein n=1 Tax=Dendrobium thyrsiflorum TaxID=117978 RepID=A0ABD0VLI1_DENTH